jgi:hypothetical protein
MAAMAKRKQGKSSPASKRKAAGNAGKGRKKGSANKVTTEVRECVRLITENLAPEVEAWIRRGARRSPLGAAKVMLGLLEFTVPKLQRIEHTGKDGDPLVQEIVRRVIARPVEPPPPNGDQ